MEAHIRELLLKPQIILIDFFFGGLVTKEEKGSSDAVQSSLLQEQAHHPRGKDRPVPRSTDGRLGNPIAQVCGCNKLQQSRCIF